MQILLIMLIVVFLAFSVLLLALAKQSPREKQTEDKEQEEYIRDYVRHILVVDNFSTDNSVQLLSDIISEKVEVIVSNKNGGYGAGNNYGIKYLIDKCKTCKSCEYICQFVTRGRN